MPFTLSEIRERPRRLRRNNLSIDFVITIWPAIAHLIEESGIITSEHRKNDLYQMNELVISKEESKEIVEYLRQLLQRDLSETFVLPAEKSALHCRAFNSLGGPHPYWVNREYLEKFIIFCEQVENGFKIE